MARAKKTEKFVNVYKELSLEDKKLLKTELDYAIKAQEREIQKKEKEESAKELRDTLKIHDKIKFKVRKDTFEGEIIAIAVDKVQVLIKGKEKKTVPYGKILK